MYVKDQTLEICRAAVENDEYAIRFIKDPEMFSQIKDEEEEEDDLEEEEDFGPSM
jgi:hypothetical protein